MGKVYSAIIITADGKQAVSEFGRVEKSATRMRNAFEEMEDFADRSSKSAGRGWHNAFEDMEEEASRMQNSFADTFHTIDKEAIRAAREAQYVIHAMNAAQLADFRQFTQQHANGTRQLSRDEQRTYRETAQTCGRYERDKVQAVQRGVREQTRAVEDGANKQISIFGRVKNGIRSMFDSLRGGGSGGSILPGLSNISNIISAIPQIGQMAGSLTRPLTDAAEEGVRYNAFLENTQIGLETLLKSAPDAKQAAQELLATLQAFSERTPFEFEDIVKNTQSLMGMKFAADEVIPSLTGIGDAIAATGDFSQERLQGVITALGQMRLKGKVSAEEMMQLSERQIDAWGLLSKAIGKTTEETMQLAQQGKLRGKEATQAIVAMMEAEFGGAMERQSKTYTGLLSTATDIKNRAQAVATKGMFEDIKGMLDAATQQGDLANTLANGINRAITPVSGLIRGTVQTVLGGGITGGLIEAIKSAEGILPSYVWSLFESGIRNPFKAAAKINSPSLVFYGFGINMAEGLMLGLQDGMKGVDLRKYLEGLLNDPRVRAFLDTIAKAEGADYNTLVGSTPKNPLTFSDFSRKPDWYNKALDSTASGRYQFLDKTWKDASSALGLTDFSPHSQDLAALWLAEFKKNKDGSQRKAISTLLSGDTAGAITASRKEWASFPNAGYGQGERSMQWMLKTFQQSLGSASGGFQGGVMPVRITNFDQLLSERDAATSRFKREAAEAATRVGLKIPGLNSDIEGGATEQAREWRQAQANAPAFKFTDVEWTADKAKLVLDTFNQARELITDTGLSTNQLSQTITPRAITATNELGEALLKSGASVKAQTLGAGDWYQTVANEAGEAAKEAKKQAEQTAQALAQIGGQFFQNLLEKPREAIKSLWQDLKSFLLSAAQETAQSKLFGFLRGGGDSESRSSSGGGLSSIFNLFRGGGGGGAGNAVSGFRQNGVIGGIKNLLGFGGGAASAAAGGLPSIAGGAASQFAAGFMPVIPGIGAGVAAGAGTAAATGGAAAATGAAAGGASGGAFAGVLPFLTNPFTIAAAGAAIGGFMLWKHFKSGTEKRLREAIQSEYQIQVKDMKTLSEIKQIGEQSFGRGNVGKHLLETIRLEPAKELLASYAESTGQQSKLVTQKQLADPNFAGNQFVHRIAGGIIPGLTRGFDHVPILGDGGEYMLRSDVTAREGLERVEALNEGRATIIPKAPKPRVPVVSAPVFNSSSQSSSSSNSSNESAVSRLLATMLAASTQTMEGVRRELARLKVQPAGVIVRDGIKQNPHSVADGLEETFNQSYKSDSLRRKMQGSI